MVSSNLYFWLEVLTFYIIVLYKYFDFYNFFLTASNLYMVRNLIIKYQIVKY